MAFTSLIFVLEKCWIILTKPIEKYLFTFSLMAASGQS